MNIAKSRHSTPESYVRRTYRLLEKSGLVSSSVRMVETDLHILAPLDVTEKVMLLVSQIRSEIEKYIKKNPEFQDSLVPLPLDKSAPGVVRKMLKAGCDIGVGPMASVAGAIAEEVGLGLANQGINDIIVENGGDIYISRVKEAVISIFAGNSPLSEKIGIKLSEKQMPCGICCSSGTIGHSLSLGQADAVVVTAPSTPLADAAATSIGNEVKKNTPGSMKNALEKAKQQNELREHIDNADEWIFLSCLPWMNFTALTNPHGGPDDCIPRISWGQLHDQGSKWMIPVGIQVHHALMDGIHVGKFYEALAQSIATGFKGS